MKSNSISKNPMEPTPITRLLALATAMLFCLCAGCDVGPGDESALDQADLALSKADSSGAATGTISAVIIGSGQDLPADPMNKTRDRCLGQYNGCHDRCSRYFDQGSRGQRNCIDGCGTAWEYCMSENGTARTAR